MKVSTKLLVLALLISMQVNVSSQVRIIDDGSAGLGTMQPHSSAKFHIVVDRENNPQGFLMPIMLIGERESINGPADGLMVYVEDDDAAIRGPYYWSSSSTGPGMWVRMDSKVVNWGDIVNPPDGLGDGDNQGLLSGVFNGNNLTIEIEDGSPVTIDMSPILSDFWSFGGDDVTDGTTLGTTNGEELNLVTDGQIRVIVDEDGRTIFKYNNTDNTFIGEGSGATGVNGGRNIFFQTNSAVTYSQGHENIVLGTNSGNNLTNGYQNTFIGSDAGQNISNGHSNIHIGPASGLGSNAYSSSNSFIGSFAGNNSSGNENVFIGTEAGAGSSNGFNVALGSRAGKGSGVSFGNRLHIHSSQSTVGNESLIYGEFDNGLLDINGELKIRDVPELTDLQSDDRILVQDASTGEADKVRWTSADALTANAWSTSLNDDSAGHKLGTFDSQPLEMYTANLLRLTIDTEGRLVPRFKNSHTSIAIGLDAGSNSPTNSSGNTFLGWLAGGATTNHSNTMVGANAGQLNSTGIGNTYLGKHAGSANTTGWKNVAVGHFSDIQADCENQVSWYSTFLGSNSGSTICDIHHGTAIGSNALVNRDYKINLFTGYTDDVSEYTSGIIEGDVAFSVTSDSRFKKFVQEDVPGLEMIMRLRPVSYKFDYLDYMSHLTQNFPDSTRLEKMSEYSHATLNSRNRTGFLAQEVEQACDDIHYEFGGLFKDDPNNSTSNYSLAYGMFVVPLVKAVQEQQGVIQQQSDQIDELRNRLDQLEQMFEEFQRQ